MVTDTQERRKQGQGVWRMSSKEDVSGEETHGALGGGGQRHSGSSYGFTWEIPEDIQM